MSGDNIRLGVEAEQIRERQYDPETTGAAANVHDP